MTDVINAIVSIWTTCDLHNLLNSIHSQCNHHTYLANQRVWELGAGLVLNFPAERRQRVAIDKSIQAAQQARGRSDRGALAGAPAMFHSSLLHLTPSRPLPRRSQANDALHGE